MSSRADPAAAMADLEEGEIRCWRCGRNGHCGSTCEETTNVCGEPIACCSRCGKWDHSTKHCREVLNVIGLRLDSVQCSSCGTYGHHVSRCNSRIPMQLRCCRCAFFGHVIGDCTETHTVLGDCLSGDGDQQTIPSSEPMPNKKVAKPPALWGCCKTCGRWDHESRNCTYKFNVVGVRIDRTLCTRCGEYGHLSRECTKENPRGNRCRRCGKFGHPTEGCDSQVTVYGDNIYHVERCGTCRLFFHSSERCHTRMRGSNEVRTLVLALVITVVNTRPSCVCLACV
ncbi:unnamed protein product [Ectocarpus sp. 6 AP-2014]